MNKITQSHIEKMKNIRGIDRSHVEIKERLKQRCFDRIQEVRKSLVQSERAKGSSSSGNGQVAVAQPKHGAIPPKSPLKANINIKSTLLKEYDAMKLDFQMADSSSSSSSRTSSSQLQPQYSSSEDDGEQQDPRFFMLSEEEQEQLLLELQAYVDMEEMEERERLEREEIEEIAYYASEYEQYMNEQRNW
ncbi:hypothetical protein DFA_05839 [Cavenderia fasciculata]|uniref:Uncharacterized protein n=1 Tax=Cavenderia fasciculata TaxID=261658 RepID=F4PMW1_CACFS|nr:uncharacterized protein DFA_05839 [Cavenderia fasciculata]EGG23705.1 hypothetical protein DFA_05839 [Cavenderia fasciculata]|eukprot:XP_004361556.1 hypothetical protein DFA_05839 [Cavenderia fasciculata]